MTHQPKSWGAWVVGHRQRAWAKQMHEQALAVHAETARRRIEAEMNLLRHFRPRKTIWQRLFGV